MEEVKRYAEMKDSGMPWFTEVSSSWNPARIKTFLRNKSIKNHPEAEVLSLYRDWGIVPKNSRDDNHNVTAEDTSSYKYVEIGDLVINKMKAWQGSLAISEYEGIVSPAYYVCLFEGKKVNSRFIHHLFRCKAFAQRFECLSTGMRIGQWDLGIDDFLHEIIFLPPFDEQQAIASYLDDKCSTIDDIIASARTSIDDYKQLKASTIYEAVTKGLNPDVEMKGSVVEWIGKIPEHWDICRISVLCKSIETGPFGSQLHAEDYVEGGFPIINPINIKNGRIIPDSTCTISENKIIELQRHFLSKDDIIFGRRGEMGRCARVDIDKAYICGTGCIKISLNSCKTNAQFLCYFLVSSRIKEYLELHAVGSTLKNLNGAIIGAIPVPHPPISEQKAIADYLDTRCAEIDSLIAEKEALIADLEAYKKSLIYECVTGKRRVTEESHAA